MKSSVTVAIDDNSKNISALSIGHYTLMAQELLMVSSSNLPAAQSINHYRHANGDEAYRAALVRFALTIEIAEHRCTQQAKAEGSDFDDLIVEQLGGCCSEWMKMVISHFDKSSNQPWWLVPAGDIVDFTNKAITEVKQQAAPLRVIH